MKKALSFIATAAILLAGLSCTTTSSTLDSPDVQRIYNADYDRVFSDAVNAVTLLSWELTHTEKEAGLIQAQTPKNMLTNGDRVSIRVVSQGDGNVKVDMSSGTNQAIDWGKNKQNIRKFFNELDESLGDTRVMITPEETNEGIEQ